MKQGIFVKCEALSSTFYSQICFKKKESEEWGGEDGHSFFFFLRRSFLTRKKIVTDNGNPLQYSCLENPMDRGAWWAAVHVVMKSRTRLSDFTFTFHFHALEKEMATHSSVLTWRIPGTGEPGGLPSKGSHRVGHDWGDLAAAAAEISKY